MVAFVPTLGRLVSDARQRTKKKKFGGNRVYSVKDIATMARISPAYLSSIEHDSTPYPPSEEVLKRLATVLEIPLDKVLESCPPHGDADKAYVRDHAWVRGLIRALRETKARKDVIVRLTAEVRGIALANRENSEE